MRRFRARIAAARLAWAVVIAMSALGVGAAGVGAVGATSAWAADADRMALAQTVRGASRMFATVSELAPEQFEEALDRISEIRRDARSPSAAAEAVRRVGDELRRRNARHAAKASDAEVREAIEAYAAVLDWLAAKPQLCADFLLRGGARVMDRLDAESRRRVDVAAAAIFRGLLLGAGRTLDLPIADDSDWAVVATVWNSTPEEIGAVVRRDASSAPNFCAGVRGYYRAILSTADPIGARVRRSAFVEMVAK